MSDRETSEFEHLSADQRARVDALRAARGIIATTAAFSRAGADPIDVVAVARFILTGRDPWLQNEAIRNLAGEEIATSGDIA